MSGENGSLRKASCETERDLAPDGNGHEVGEDVGGHEGERGWFVKACVSRKETGNVLDWQFQRTKLNEGCQDLIWNVSVSECYLKPALMRLWHGHDWEVVVEHLYYEMLRRRTCEDHWIEPLEICMQGEASQAVNLELYI
jgi:hypothetical protein